MPDQPESNLVPGVLELLRPPGPPAPVVFDSPHSGNQYPQDFRHAMPVSDIRLAEDAFVDELFGAAPEYGATLLRALFPRSYIDPNRTLDDVDEDMLDGPWPGAAPGDKVRLGVGLIARRYASGQVYDRRLSVAEVRARIARYYRPYHLALERALDEAVARSGAVWHVNCHSMPAVSSSISPEGPGMERPEICLGDRDGETCEPGFTRLVKETLEEMGYRVSVNDPYKGVELVRRYSAPERGRHSLQLEINRALYMDEPSVSRASGFETLRRDLGALAARVCAYATQATASDQAAE